MNQPTVGQARMADDHLRAGRAHRRREHSVNPPPAVLKHDRTIQETVAVVGEELARVQECAVARPVDQILPGLRPGRLVCPHCRACHLRGGHLQISSHA